GRALPPARQSRQARRLLRAGSGQERVNQWAPCTSRPSRRHSRRAPSCSPARASAAPAGETPGAKVRTAPVTTGKDGTARLVIQSARYIAEYRDGAGVVQVVPTGCRDEQAARRVLGDLERRAELIRAGVMSAPESAVADH